MTVGFKKAHLPRDRAVCFFSSVHSLLLNESKELSRFSLHKAIVLKKHAFMPLRVKVNDHSLHSTSNNNTQVLLMLLSSYLGTTVSEARRAIACKHVFVLFQRKKSIFQNKHSKLTGTRGIGDVAVPPFCFEMFFKQESYGS
jgi:hypothetical protein